MIGQDQSRRRLTYIGKRITASGRLVGFRVDEEGTQYGYRKALGPAAPGARYDVALSADGSVLLGGDDAPRYVDRLPAEDERVLEWSAQDRIAQGMHAQAARGPARCGHRRPGGGVPATAAALRRRALRGGAGRPAGGAYRANHPTAVEFGRGEAH